MEDRSFTKNEMICAATLWWTHQMGADIKIRPTKPEESFDSLLKSVVSMFEEKDESPLFKFARIIYRELYDNLHFHREYLDTLCGPDKLLTRACKESGLDPDKLPKDTCMNIELVGSVINLSEGGKWNYDVFKYEDELEKV